ncbi:4'-phosphopantetheinyl transferase superfamily protein [Neobacillus mesonae]|nr:4'-phosphopantetheinyl transferase superfamily protein [Neobacillus mesonae]
MDVVAVRLHSAIEQPMDLTRYIELLAPEQQNKIKRFRRYPDQLRSLCGELLVRSYAAAEWKLAAGDLDRQMNPYGKPEFKRFPQYQYNITHSGCWVAAIFDGQFVGIDVEEIADIELSIADRFFTDNEAKWLQSLDKTEQKKAFYELWTLKESYVKAVGSGLSLPLNSFEFMVSEQGNLEFFSTEQGNSLWHFKQYAVDTEYALAACARSSHLPDAIEIWSWNELLSKL